MFVRVGPAIKRKIFAGPAGLRVLAIGGTPGEAYELSAFGELENA